MRRICEFTPSLPAGLARRSIAWLVSLPNFLLRAVVASRAPLLVYSRFTMISRAG